MGIQTQEAFIRRFGPFMPSERENRDRNNLQRDREFIVGNDGQPTNVKITKEYLERQANQAFNPRGIYKVPNDESIFHQWEKDSRGNWFINPNLGNQKYISNDGSEWILDKNDNLILTGPNAGTYNFGPTTTTPPTFLPRCTSLHCVRNR